MPRLLLVYLARRISLLVILLEIGLCVPVIVTQLVHYLPASAIRSGLLLPAVMGISPTVIYLALPMAVGVAVALEFSRMASEGMIAVLYSLRLSVLSICLPATIVAAVAAAGGYWISCFVAPGYVGKMHDVIYVVRNSLNHRLLEPAQFYTFDNGARTLYFKRWKTPDIVEGMFIRQYNQQKKEEEIITAKQTEFRRNDHGVLLVMSRGSFQSRPDGSDEVRTADFDEYVIQLDMQGTNGMPTENRRRDLSELPLQGFLSAEPGSAAQRSVAKEWISEAAKRFFVPILALTHALLAIGLVLALSNATGRTATTVAAFAIVPAVHFAILISTESLNHGNPRLILFSVGVLIAIEFIVAFILIGWQQTHFFVARPAETARRLPRERGRQPENSVV